MQIGGGAELVVDGEPVDLSRGHVYKGLMLSDVPNVAMAVGYTNASWTLRADLSARWFCSLLRYLDRHGLPWRRPATTSRTVGERPLLDLTSGYVQRAAHLLPRQGERRPWRVVQATCTTWRSPGSGRIDDGHLELR